VLAHYLARWDGGRYAKVLLHGDIHQENADKIGITRSQVKTVTYCFLYGGGDIKLGHSYDKQLPEDEARKKGKEIRKAYVAAIPGLADFLEAVRKAVSRGYVLGLDHRRILCESRHKSVNYLIQGSSAIIAKRWMVLTHDHIKEMGLCCSQLAFVHDELQFECTAEHVDDLKSLLVLSAIEAGEYYKLRCPLSAESKSGGTWADVH
jgi:DNA polymerase I-like protein with 3'-5' exonuclease and polymerase domains